jgi:hypothetical protein
VRFFLIAFLNPPCYETPKNSIKKSDKTTEGGNKTKKEEGGTNSRIFCDEPKWTFSERNVRVFELPLLRNAQKTPVK